MKEPGRKMALYFEKRIIKLKLKFLKIKTSVNAKTSNNRENCAVHINLLFIIYYSSQGSNLRLFLCLQRLFYHAASDYTNHCSSRIKFFPS